MCNEETYEDVIEANIDFHDTDDGGGGDDDDDNDTNAHDDKILSFCCGI